MSVLDLVTFVLVLTAAAAFIAFPIAYQWTTGGAWINSVMGRHLMGFMGVIALVMVLAVWTRLAGPLPEWVRPAVWAAINFIAWWRLFLVIRLRHGDADDARHPRPPSSD